MSQTPSLRLALESLWNLLCCAWALVRLLSRNLDILLRVLILAMTMLLPLVLVVTLSIPFLMAHAQTNGYVVCAPIEHGVKCKWASADCWTDFTCDA